jgi:hypothetical protein
MGFSGAQTTVGQFLLEVIVVLIHEGVQSGLPGTIHIACFVIHEQGRGWRKTQTLQAQQKGFRIGLA